MKYRKPYQYRNDGAAFASDILGVKVWDGLVEFLDAIRDNKNTVVVGCFGSAKTFNLAVAAAWFISTNVDSKVPTTAPGQRQVRDLLWSEIAHLHSQSKILLPGVCTVDRWHISKKWYAAGFTGQKYNEASFQGYHAPRVMYAIDEATGVDSQVYNARRKLLMSHHDRFVAIGNALDRNTEFGRSFIDPSFYKIRIRASDTPNVKAGKTVIPGMVTTEWVDEMRKYEGTQLWNTYVEAQFPDDNDNSMFPLAWIEAAFDRYDEYLQGRGFIRGNEKYCGCDVATGGMDRTVIAKAIGNCFEPLTVIRGNDTQETANALEIEIKRGYSVAVDSIGVGAGVSDALFHRGYYIRRTVGSESSDVTDSTMSFGFANKRTEMYWNLRCALDPKNPQALMLARDEELREELGVHTYEPIAGGKIRVLQKEKVCEKLGHSPDKADALTIALEAKFTPSKPVEIGQITDTQRRSSWYGNS